MPRSHVALDASDASIEWGAKSRGVERRTSEDPRRLAQRPHGASTPKGHALPAARHSVVRFAGSVDKVHPFPISLFHRGNEAKEAERVFARLTVLVELECTEENHRRPRRVVHARQAFGSVAAR